MPLSKAAMAERKKKERVSNLKRADVKPKRCECCGKTDAEIKEIVQWGLDRNRISVSDEVMEYYGLRKPIAQVLNEALKKLDNFKEFDGNPVMIGGR